MVCTTASAGVKLVWLLADQPNATSGYNPDPAHSFDSANAGMAVLPSGTGAYSVLADEIVRNTGNVQVTVYGSSNHCWTETNTGGRADVFCYDASGNRANTEFALFYQYRSGNAGNVNHTIAFATIANGFAGGAGSPYNSTGGTVTGTRNGTGLYTVLFSGLTNSGGQIQITPYLPNSGSPRCTASGWSASVSGTTVNVGCVANNAAPVNTGFILTYSYGVTFGNYGIGGPFYGAYTFANQPTATKRYAPGDHYQYNTFGTGPLSIQRTGTGLYTVTVPGSPTFARSIALVSAVGPAVTWCNVMSLSGTVVNVGCFAQGGVPTDSKFTLTFQASAS
jgi:hypothetical protein